MRKVPVDDAVGMDLGYDITKIVPGRDKYRAFRRGQVIGPEGWEVEILPGQKPSMIRSMLGCNALIDVPAGNRGLTAGDRVSIIPLNRYIGL